MKYRGKSIELGSLDLTRSHFQFEHRLDYTKLFTSLEVFFLALKLAIAASLVIIKSALS